MKNTKEQITKEQEQEGRKDDKKEPEKDLKTEVTLEFWSEDLMKSVPAIQNVW